MKYAFIQSHANHWSVVRQCEVLGASRSGYYDWRKRDISSRDEANQTLDRKIQEIFKVHRGRCGSLRTWKELVILGIKSSLNRVKRRFKALNLYVITRKKFKATTDSGHALPIASNLLNRDLSTTDINQKWVGDITYIPTDQGWLYLAIILDLYSRKLIGWAMSKRINQRLVCDALSMAFKHRQLPEGVLIHSDRGSQYCSKSYQKLIKNQQCICSMSRKANCWDNAVAESFFKTLKAELIYQNHYKTREQAQGDIFNYIETYYNRIRRHSAIDYFTPYEVEQERLMMA